MLKVLIQKFMEDGVNDLELCNLVSFLNGIIQYKNQWNFSGWDLEEIDDANQLFEINHDTNDNLYYITFMSEYGEICMMLEGSIVDAEDPMAVLRVQVHTARIKSMESEVKRLEDLRLYYQREIDYSSKVIEGLG